MTPLSLRLLLLRQRMSDSGRLAVSDASVIEAAMALAKRYEDAPVAELYHTRHERNQYYGELYAENLPDGWEPAYTAITAGEIVRLVREPARRGG